MNCCYSRHLSLKHFVKATPENEYTYIFQEWQARSISALTSDLLTCLFVIWATRKKAEGKTDVLRRCPRGRGLRALPGLPHYKRHRKWLLAWGWLLRWREQDILTQQGLFSPGLHAKRLNAPVLTHAWMCTGACFLSRSLGPRRELDIDVWKNKHC